MTPLDLPPELLVFTAVEDSFVAAIKASPIAALLKEVATLPGDLSPREVGDRLRVTPGAYIRFTGGDGLPMRGAALDARFTVYVVTGLGAAEEQRRRGSKVIVGTYTLLQLVMKVLHGNQLPAPAVDGTPIAELTIGAPQLLDAACYGTEEVDNLGLSIYGATFSLQMQFPPLPIDGDMTDFLTFTGQIARDGDTDGGDSLPLPTGDVLSEDDVSLPTE